MTHFHDTYCIGITLDGYFGLNINKKTFHSYAKSVKVINPGDIHSGESKEWCFYSFYLPTNILQEHYEQLHGIKELPFFAKAIIEDEILYHYFLDFFQSAYTQKSFLEVESKLTLALSHLIKFYAQNTPFKEETQNHNIQKAVDYLQSQPINQVNLSELANVAGLSKYHFLRLFKEQTGLTPHAYILQEKVYAAKEFIKQGGSLSQAALHAGFSDQSHLNKNFKKLFGYTPKTLKHNPVLQYR